MDSQLTADSLIPTLKTDIDSLESIAVASKDSKYRQYKLGEINDWTEVHEYKGPNGVGYVVYFYVIKDKRKWVKVEHKGREPLKFSEDWVEVVEDEI